MFKALIIFAFMLLTTSCTRADVGDAFERYLWQNRILLVFAPRLNNSDFQQQISALEKAQDELKERDIVLWSFVNLEQVIGQSEHKAHLSTNPFYKEFDVNRRDFAVILIGKDGEEKLRQNKALKIETLLDTIDAMPMRRREIQSKHKP